MTNRVIIGDGDQETPFSQCRAFLARRWIAVGLSFALAMVGAAGLLRILAPAYTAHADILLGTPWEKPLDAVGIPRRDGSDVDTAIALTTSSALLGRVVDAEHLTSDPEFGAAHRSFGRAFASLLWFPIVRPQALPLEAQAMAALRQDLRVERLGKASGFSISVTNSDPEKAARLADAVADAFMRDQQQTPLQVGRRASTFFAEGLGPWTEARPDAPPGHVRPEGDLLAETASGGTVRQDSKSKRAAGTAFGATVRIERREIEQAIARELAGVLARSRGAHEVAKSQDVSLRALPAVTTGAVGLDNDLDTRLHEVERLALVVQTLFEAYLSKADLGEKHAVVGNDLRIVSPAERPVAPAYPPRVTIMGCMSVLGLALGIALGLLLDGLERGFLTVRHTESVLGLRVLAEVPWLCNRERTVDGKLVDPMRYLASRPYSPYAEAVHAIRVGIRMSEGPPAQVALVTSSGAGEGKSMIALGLALSAARAGQRVLLLDADLRSPTLSCSFGHQHRLGLVDMLTGLVGSEEATIALGAGLALMPSGRRSAVAPDLFASNRMARYMEHLRTIYDLVVIDAAPAGTVVDARVLAALSDRIVFVVAWRSTARESITRDLRTLGNPGKIAGVVLNKVDKRGSPYGRVWDRGAKFAQRNAEA